MKEDNFQEKISSPGLVPQQPMSIQQGNALQSIQFERKDFQEKKSSQSLVPLSQKQRGEQSSK